MGHRGAMGAAAAVVVSMLACVGGAATGEADYGNPEGGVWLGGEDGAAAGAIAVAAHGRFIAWRYQPDEGPGRLAIGFPDDGATVQTEVLDPVRLAFAPDAPVVYVVHEHGEGGITAYDVDQGVRWSVPLPEVAVSGELDVSADGRLLLLHHAQRAAVLDAMTGQTLLTRAFERPLRDADILPGDDRVAFVEAEQWVEELPWAQITVVQVDGAEVVASFEIPNCGARLEVVPTTLRGFLAPTLCAQDPVSVLSLEAGAEQFERNLPGFGPVAVAPEGDAVLAFYDHAQRDPDLFDDPTRIPDDDGPQYHLMRIDSHELTFELLPWGDAMPRYAIDRSGAAALVDSLAGFVPTSILDMDLFQLREVDGPQLTLDRFAFSPDGGVAYALRRPNGWPEETEPGLYELELATATASRLEVPFVPTSLNVSPDGSTLFLRRDGTHVCVWDLPTGRCRRSLELANRPL